MSPDLKAITTLWVDGFEQNPYRYRIECAECGCQSFAGEPPARCAWCRGFDLVVEPFGPQFEEIPSCRASTKR